MHFETRDLEEATQVVGSVYCPHELRLDRRASFLDASLTASVTGNASVIRLAYGAHVTVDAGEFPELYLFMRCLAGEGAVRQRTATAAWRAGVTIPVSAWRQTGFDFGASFTQVTFRPDVPALNACCARLLGRPLEDSLRFDLAPFTPEFERIWTSVLDLLGTLPAALPGPARAALDEFVLTTLLTGHHHNYTDALSRQEAVTRPASLVGRAEAFIHDHLDDTTLTISHIANALGVSMRALQAAFHEHRRMTPTGYLRQVRLRQVRQRLLDGPEGDKVIDVALTYGFLHLGRFADQYKKCFGEAPSDTLRLRRRRRGHA
jgi:AraC-like DNA-binding protein